MQASRMHELDWPAAEPIETAPRARHTEMPLLLWCPDQGGWHTGVWFEHRWLDSVELDMELRPTHWMPAPPPPQALRLSAIAMTGISAWLLSDLLPLFTSFNCLFWLL
jgi:hypothetical protein